MYLYFSFIHDGGEGAWQGLLVASEGARVLKTARAGSTAPNSLVIIPGLISSSEEDQRGS